MARSLAGESMLGRDREGSRALRSCRPAWQNDYRITVRIPAGSLATDAQTAIQFVRSTPGVTTALVGMSSVEHVEENLALVRVEPASEQTFQDSSMSAERYRSFSEFWPLYMAEHSRPARACCI